MAVFNTTNASELLVELGDRLGIRVLFVEDLENLPRGLVPIGNPPGNAFLCPGSTVCLGEISVEEDIAYALHEMAHAIHGTKDDRVCHKAEAVWALRFGPHVRR